MKTKSMVLLCALVTGILWGCSRTEPVRYQAVLDKISQASEAEMPALIYGYEQTPVPTRGVLLGMVRPLRAPSPEQHMTVEAVRQTGNFTMIVARIPWRQNLQPSGLCPIIITGKPGKERVVGEVLPFNDLFPLIAQEDMHEVTELSQWWVETFVKRPGTWMAVGSSAGGKGQKN